MSDNLQKCDVVLLFCSPSAMNSKAVKKEWTAADSSDKPLIPVFTNIKYVPTLLRTRKGVHINDVFNVDANIKRLHKLILKKYGPKEVAFINIKFTYNKEKEKVKTERNSSLLENLIGFCKKYGLSANNISLTNSRGDRVKTADLDDPVSAISSKYGNEFDITIESMQIIGNFKICIMGDSNVGKSQLLQHCIEGRFDEDLEHTVGTDYWVKQFNFQSQDKNLDINLIFWDFGGLKQFSGAKMRENLDKTDGVFIVGDITQTKSFDRIEKYWLPEMRKHLNINIPIILLANKADLKPKIEKKEIKSIAKAFGIDKVFWTSAKNGLNVEEAFKSILFPIIERELNRL